MAVRQAKSAFGTDTGTEATHGTLPNNPSSYSGNIAAGDVNQNINRQVDDASTFLIRFLIQCDGGSTGTNIAPQFEYSKNGGAFTSITTTSANIKAVTPNAFANAAATTSRLQGTGTFETSSQGCTTDGLAGGAQFDIVANGNGETICGVQLVPADLAVNDTLDLRISGLITVYDFVPRITITAGAVNFTGNTLAGSLTVTGLVPTLQTDHFLTVGAGTVTLTGLAPALSAGATLAPSASAVTVTGFAPTVSVGLSERLTPNAVVAGGSNLRDTLTNSPPTRFADIDEETGSDDGEWWTAVNPNNDIDIRLGFPTSAGTLVGTMTMRARIRGTSLPCRPVTLALWENGSQVAASPTIVVTESVTSTVGQIVTLTFDASVLADPTGAGVELRISAAT